MNESTVELEAILKADPGDPRFAEYAEQLRTQGRFDEAMRVCYAGLSANPACHAGRLVLAWLYYDQGFRSFCVREVLEIQQALPEVKSLKRLIEKLAPGEKVAVASPAAESGEEVVAESEFEFDDLDDLENDLSGKGGRK